MKTPESTTYEPLCGCYINDACKEAVAQATRINQNVSFLFNGVQLVATPNTIPADLEAEYSKQIHANADRYAASPEGQAAEVERKRRLISAQNRVDALMAKLNDVYTNERELMRWLGQFASSADHVGVKWDQKRLAKTLRKAGYKAGDACGLNKSEYRKPRTMARYVVGQVLSCLDHGMPPHPMTEDFVAKYMEVA